MRILWLESLKLDEHREDDGECVDAVLREREARARPGSTAEDRAITVLVIFLVFLLLGLAGAADLVVPG